MQRQRHTKKKGKIYKGKKYKFLLIRNKILNYVSCPTRVFSETVAASFLMFVLHRSVFPSFACFLCVLASYHKVCSTVCCCLSLLNPFQWHDHCLQLQLLWTFHNAMPDITVSMFMLRLLIKGGRNAFVASCTHGCPVVHNFQPPSAKVESYR